MNEDSLRPFFIMRNLNGKFCVFLLAGWVLWTCGAAAKETERGEEAGILLERKRLLRSIREHSPTTPYIVINTQENLVLLKDGDRVLRSAVCSSGSGRKLKGPKRWKHNWVFNTPKGRFAILRKVQDPLWIKPEWVFVEAGEEIPIFAEDRRRFQRGVLGRFALYFARDYMIHGALYEVNLGKSITHGCVRVGEEDLRYLYDTVEKGWPVYIY